MATDALVRYERLSVGFIGGGFMAEVHSRAARQAGARLAGLASSTPERAAHAVDRLGIERAYPSAQDMVVDDNIQVVHICTPNSSHLPLALAVLKAGKHVICEKPLATSVSDARALVEQAAVAGVAATVPFVYRYHPMVREARARIRRGELGSLLSIQGLYLQDWLLDERSDDWRVDSAVGGRSRAFADIGSHLVDLIEFVSGDRIVRLSALTRTVFSERATNRNIATEDIAAVVVQTLSGAIGTLLVSQTAPGRKNHLAVEFAGTAESIRFEQERPETLWLGRQFESVILARDPHQLSSDGGRLSTLPAGHPLGYQDAFNAFVEDSYAAVHGESPEGLPMFSDGLRAAVITDAVITSAATGGWVDLIRD